MASRHDSMLFNSVAFLIFFPLVTLGYFLLRGWRSRVALLLCASCLFYMAFVPSYILILAFTIVVDYAAGILIAQATRYRRLFLMASIVANVGVLAIFKYYGFLVDNTVAVAGLFGYHLNAPALALVLPIGLSFHTFQAMSYTIEVYRGRQQPERNFAVYALYVMFYPQLVAGPIERPQNLLPHFRHLHGFDYVRVTSGLRRMAWGLFKKVVVADRLGATVDLVFDHHQQYHGLALLIATVMFAFQIYLDFSAYSDIALGSARVMGFELMENFRTPYFATTVSEFWRRWHISLSTWFKDYVYVPLGGSRTSAWRHYRNLMVVFMLSGLWHGAAWTFVIWGALHGAYLVVGHATAPARQRLARALRLPTNAPAMRLLAILSTFALTTFAWIFFRARTTEAALHIVTHLPSGMVHDLSALVASRGRALPLPGVPFRMALIALVLAVEWFAASWTGLDAFVRRLRPLPRYALYLVVVYATVFGTDDGSLQQFIYFQF